RSTYATMRSVEFDSIILADGVEPVTEIALLISESWRHLKAIAAYGDACTLLDNCDFQRTDPGICFGSELGDVVDFIAEALAEHRVWSRTAVSARPPRSGPRRPSGAPRPGRFRRRSAAAPPAVTSDRPGRRRPLPR